jgi:hypothetical protein
VTGEVAEFEEVRLLGLQPAPARQSGWDATRLLPREKVERLQIKGRCVVDRYKPGAKLGKIDIKKEWDAVLLVLLDSNYDATVILRAEREAVVAALKAPGSRARNERGQLALGKFRSIGRLIWSRDSA